MKDFVQATTLASINANTFNNTFQILQASLPEACMIVRFINDSDTDVLISYNGSTNHDYLVAGTQMQLDLQANSQPGNFTSLMKKGQVVYVKGAGAGTGFVYMTGYYQK